MLRLAKLEFVSDPSNTEQSGVGLQWGLLRGMKEAVGKGRIPALVDADEHKGRLELETARDVLTDPVLFKLFQLQLNRAREMYSVEHTRPGKHGMLDGLLVYRHRRGHRLRRRAVRGREWWG